MEVLMVAAELAPYARATEAADAVPSLAKALRQLGHRVTVALPRHRGFEAQGLLVARRLTPLAVGPTEVTVFDGQLASGVEMVLFEVPGQGDRDDVYAEAGTASSPAELERFAMFARAAAALAEKRREQGKPFEVVHGHDWPGALVGAFLDPSVASLVVTIHDARRAGFFARSALEELTPGIELGERPSALALGIARARAITTVSGTYARELSEQGAAGIPSSVFASLADPAFGIENGVDYAVFNPATDSLLEARYDAEDPWGKARTKGVVLRKLRLDLDIARPLAVFAAPLGEESGADLVLEALPALLKNDLAVIVLGTGDARIAEKLRAASDERPELFAFVEDRDDELVRRLHAAADFALVPSRYSPSAFAAKLAQRYGALPVAHATGGLLEAVVDCDAELETGTGFLFDRPSATALVAATERALTAYASEAGFTRLRRRAMRLDLAWDRPARRYAQVYRRAIEGT
ncbi:MAG TPA: glycogen/starch synthase [Polyangiaceae bacterium]|nr:glycogen/starch synthase [Polyangiaceae bacterium]